MRGRQQGYPAQGRWGQQECPLAGTPALPTATFYSPEAWDDPGLSKEHSSLHPTARGLCKLLCNSLLAQHLWRMKGCFQLALFWCYYQRAAARAYHVVKSNESLVWGAGSLKAVSDTGAIAAKQPCARTGTDASNTSEKQPEEKGWRRARRSCLSNCVGMQKPKARAAAGDARNPQRRVVCGASRWVRPRGPLPVASPACDLVQGSSSWLKRFAFLIRSVSM